MSSFTFKMDIKNIGVMEGILDQELEDLTSPSSAINQP